MRLSGVVPLWAVGPAFAHALAGPDVVDVAGQGFDEVFELRRQLGGRVHDDGSVWFRFRHAVPPRRHCGAPYAEHSRRQMPFQYNFLV